MTPTQPDWLPTRRADLDRLGWDAVDILLVSGDAYVDHPAFAAALLGRWLVAGGFRVGLVAQPRWDRVDDFLSLGRPRLFAGVAPGAVDSMLAHYTAFRKLRHDDPNTPGGRHGGRPNRAAIVYAGRLREAFPGLPVVLGGIEASLRRASHYDFWTDALRRPIVLDAKADGVLYGMAERPLLELARRYEAGQDISGLAGSVYAVGKKAGLPAGVNVEPLPSHEEILSDPRKLMDATLTLERQIHNGGPWLTQTVGGRTVAFAPPPARLSETEMDNLYALPFQRKAHPSYREEIPALTMLRDSVTGHRGCGGGCSFCSLALHQGRRIASRSRSSILGEIDRMSRAPDWSGAVSDIGGPSANMWGARCRRDNDPEARPCRRASCLWPERCPDFRTRPGDQLALLRTACELPGVTHVRVASGLRHDLALTEPPDYLLELAASFCGGQLKIAPEHVSETVLRLMRKPGVERFEAFLEAFEEASKAAGKRQFVLPYLMSAFPGSTDEDARELAAWLRRHGWKPQQVQCFIPTPGTVATAMYYAGIDPEGRPLPVARTDAERLRQHALLSP